MLSPVPGVRSIAFNSSMKIQLAFQYTNLWHFHSIQRSEFGESSKQNRLQSCTHSRHLQSQCETNRMSNYPFRKTVYVCDVKLILLFCLFYVWIVLRVRRYWRLTVCLPPDYDGNVDKIIISIDNKAQIRPYSSRCFYLSIFLVLIKILFTFELMVRFNCILVPVLRWSHLSFNSLRNPSHFPIANHCFIGSPASFTQRLIFSRTMHKTLITFFHTIIRLHTLFVFHSRFLLFSIFFLFWNEDWRVMLLFNQL